MLHAQGSSDVKRCYLEGTVKGKLRGCNSHMKFFLKNERNGVKNVGRVNRQLCSDLIFATTCTIYRLHASANVRNAL